MGEPHRHAHFNPGQTFKGFEIYSLERRKINFARRKGRAYPLDAAGEAAWLLYSGRTSDKIQHSFLAKIQSN